MAADFVVADPQESVGRFLAALPFNPELEELNLLKCDFDALVINGEGTMIMTDPPRRDSLLYLMLAWWACSLGKKVFFVNAVFSDCPKSGHNALTIETANEVLRHCTLVSTRDAESLEYIKRYMPDVRASWKPDALFTWRELTKNSSYRVYDVQNIIPYGAETDIALEGFDLTVPYLSISGGSSAAWDRQAAVEGYSHMVNYLKQNTDFPIILVATCTGDGFLSEVSRETGCPLVPVEVALFGGISILANAAVFISGRYHPSIMASLGGTPCIFFKSNCHKTGSLQDTLGYPERREFSAIPNEREFKEILEVVNEFLDEGDALRKRIIERVDKLSEEARRLFDPIR